MNVATIISDSQIHFTRTSIYTFIKTNPWFNGKIYLLTCPAHGLSPKNLKYIRNIYSNLEIIRCLLTPEISEFFKLNRSLLRNNEDYHSFLRFTLFFHNLTDTFYFSNLSIFCKDIKNKFNGGSFVCDSTLNYFYFKEPIKLFEDFGSLKIKSTYAFNNQLIDYLNKIDNIKFLDDLFYLNATSIINQKYNQNISKIRSTYSILYKVDMPESSSKINKIWLQKNQEACQHMNKPIKTSNKKVFYTNPKIRKRNIHKNIGLPAILNKSVIESEFKISILIPAFKASAYIKECLDSIYCQNTKATFEVLVAVDSCESTLNKLKDILKDYSNLTIYYSDTSVGPYILRNTLVDYAKYNNILFFDADDIMKNNLLSTIISYFSNVYPIRFKYLDFNNGSNYLINNSENKSVAQGVFFITKETLNKIGGFQPWLCAADTEFIKRCNFNNIKSLSINVPLFYRRIHNNSLTQNSSTGHSSDVRKKARDFIQKNKNWKIPIVVKVTHLIKI